LKKINLPRGECVDIKKITPQLADKSQMASQCDALVTRVDCCAAQSKTQSTIPLASTETQSNPPAGLAAQVLIFCEWPHREKKMGIRKEKGCIPKEEKGI